MSNYKLDRQAIIEAANYPISLCAIGVGDGPFFTIHEFTDFKEPRLFNNFNFVDFTELEK